MKLHEIQGYEEEQAEAAETAKQSYAIEEIVNSYGSGHLQYALALKQLCHHGLSVEQAKQRLAHP